MSGYKLTYFNVTARGEVSRLLFAISGVPYEDVRIEREDWPAMKNDTPFGALPVLEWGDNNRLCQSHVIEAYLAKKFGLAGHTEYEQARAAMIADCVTDMLQPLYSAQSLSEDDKAAKVKQYLAEDLPRFMKYFNRLLRENEGGNGYFVGDQMTYADLVFCNALTMMSKFLKITLPWGKYPKLDALGDRVTNNAKIREWFDKRPVTAI